MFTHIKKRFSIPKLEAINVGGKRFYKYQDRFYPSVTSVVSSINDKGIDEWRLKVGEDLANYIKETSSGIGDEFHEICNEYLKNKLSDKHVNIFPLAHFQNIRHHLDRINNIYALEKELFSCELELAGKTDCIAEFDGTPSIIDFKTSKKSKDESWIESYFLQTACYSFMWKELTGLDFPQIIIIISGADGSSCVFIKHRDEYMSRVYQVRAEWEDLYRELIDKAYGRT